MRKRLLPLMLALVLCLGLAVPALAAEKTIEVAIPCEYWKAGDFSEGLAWVRIEENSESGHIGFIDKTGEFIIPCVYDEARDFSEGLAAVAQDEKWGFIDKTGKEIVPYTYDSALDFSDGLATVMRGDKCGYIDKAGKEVIPCTYEGAGTFSEGLAAVEKDGKWGFIDKTGEEVITSKYDGALDFTDSLAGVKLNGKCGYIDKEGTEVIPCKYDSNDSFFEGLAIVEKDGKYGYIDKTGEEVIPCEYEGTGFFSDGVAPVMQDGKWGYIDKTGEVVIPCKYDDAYQFSNGVAPVMVWFEGPRRAWGYIDKTGNEIVPCVSEGPGWYLSAAPVSEGMVRVSNLVAYPNDKDAYHYVFGYLAVNGGEGPVKDVAAEVSNWAKEQVDAAAANGLIADGLGENYRVDITRAQFAAVAVKLYEAMSGETAPAAGESPFSDTSDPAVLQAEALGFVGGKGDGTFAPDSPVTREQTAAMLSRVYAKLGGEIPAVEVTEFADDADMSGYARAAIAFMSGKEVVGGVGDNKFDPQGSASIEQALVIALRMFENLK